MAKVAAKKTAKKAAPKAKAKAAPKAKPAAKAAPKAPAKPKGAAKPTPKPKIAPKPAPAPIDWIATLKSGEAGVKKWNNAAYATRKAVSFAGADLTGADLTMAKLEHADLTGADLTGALLNNISLAHSKFDEHTKWPDGFVPGSTLQWKGAGADPRKAAAAAPPAAPATPAPTDFGGFMSRLKQVTDPAKLDKAAKMLKADSFKLYAKVNADSMVGVVKSQTDPDLVYSCRLASDGTYGCGTQNLRQCGGLAGSPCKHLLVLIVGLSKGGQLDPTLAHEWTQNTRKKGPTFDKDALAATFLQYKGAEAGEVDWRPTETVPEDFYAM